MTIAPQSNSPFVALAAADANGKSLATALAPITLAREAFDPGPLAGLVNEFC